MLVSKKYLLHHAIEGRQRWKPAEFWKSKAVTVAVKIQFKSS
jgi:hypothetical protein